MTNDLVHVAPEVAATIAAGRPVVALESTVIAHGLPWPTNLETARRLEALVRESGAMPATIAIIDGVLRVGLDDDELTLLAGSSDVRNASTPSDASNTSTRSDVRKISTRDIPIAVACRWNGATTVAATLWIAHRAGIKVFATGGIGGVHRGTLRDVSADLPELARTPMIVVCSGAKIVLDLAATREWLETHAVTVIGYECDELPAFYSRQSGLAVDYRADAPEQVAKIFRSQTELGISSALLVTAPVPQQAEVPAEQLQTVLDEALHEAERNGIAGRELTPFLLSAMAQRSHGATLRANIALLENNARIAAEIAHALSD